MKNFGEILKKLRKQRDMTQEQLAEYLNITSQSVSKWETNLTLPDITLIPVLSNIFNVSADVLLGIDITAREACINEIVMESNKYHFRGQLNAAEKILREGLKEYPNSYRLMAYLAFVLQNLVKYEKEAAQAATVRDEIIRLCEKVLAECVEDKVRYMAIQYLCFTYSDMGETEKSLALADKMPGKSVSNNYLLRSVLKGAESYKHVQKEIAANLDQMLWDIIYLNDHFVNDDGNGAYNLDECIFITHLSPPVLTLSSNST